MVWRGLGALQVSWDSGGAHLGQVFAWRQLGSGGHRDGARVLQATAGQDGLDGGHSDSVRLSAGRVRKQSVPQGMSTQVGLRLPVSLGVEGEGEGAWGHQERRSHP